MARIKVLLSKTDRWEDAINQGAVYFLIEEKDQDIKFYDKDDNEVCLKIKDSKESSQLESKEQ